MTFLSGTTDPAPPVDMTGPFMPYFSEQHRAEAREEGQGAAGGRAGWSFAKFLHGVLKAIEGKPPGRGPSETNEYKGPKIMVSVSQLCLN